MATRSKVGFKNSDGTVNASYVHFDGYLNGVGVALHLNHDSDSKAKKLGYAKGIRSIELDSPVSFYNDMENDTYESEDQFHDEVYKDFEYGYLYDPSRGWLFTSKAYDTGEFIELEDQLMYDELLPGSGEYVGDLGEGYGFDEETVQDELMYAIQDLDKLEYFEFFEKYQAGLNPTDANAVSNWISDLDDEQAEGLLYALNANTGTMSDEEAMDDIMHDGPDRYNENIKNPFEDIEEVEVGVVDKAQDEEEMELEGMQPKEFVRGKAIGVKKGMANQADAVSMQTKLEEDPANVGQDAINRMDADIEESFDDLVKKVDKEKGYTKKEAEKVAGAIAAKKMKGAGKGPTAKQKARVNEDDDWIQKAIKRPGALHRALDIPQDEDIPKSLINRDIKKMDKKEDEEGKLDPKDLRFLRQLDLAKTLEKFNEAKDEDWIQKGEESGEIKSGGLKKALGIPKDEKIPAGLINKKLAQLKKKDKDKDEKGIQGLSAADRKLQKQLNLAKSFKKMDESKEIYDSMRGLTLKEYFKRFTK